MQLKPEPEVILEHYSLTELLDLVRNKAERLTEERLQEARSHLEALSNMVAPGAGMTTHMASFPPPSSVSAPEDPKRRGRPLGSKSTTEDAPRRKYNRRDGRKKSLKDHLLEVMTPEPMGVNEILDALKANGFRSKAEDPRRILYLELSRQVEEGVLVKISRGTYALND